MANQLSPLTLCAYVLADIHSDDPSLAYSVGNCRVYRFSTERLEIIAPLELPDRLASIKLTINRGGMLAVNVPAKITRRVRFEDYLLIELSLAQKPDQIDQYSIQRMNADLVGRKVTHMDSELLFEALVGQDVQIPYVDGFIYSGVNFQIEIRGATIRSNILSILSLHDYKMYLMINRICCQQTQREFGYFDRELVVNRLDGVSFGPLTVLVAYETYLWSVEAGMRNSLVEIEGVKLNYNPELLFQALASKLQTPNQDHSAWVVDLAGMLRAGAGKETKKKFGKTAS